MPELTREEKLKLVENLPHRLQDLLYSEDTGAVLLYLGQKYNLPDEKVHLLSKLVGDIILSIVPIANIIQEIIAKIISDPQTAANLAQDLNNEIFIPKPVVPIAPSPITPQPVAPPAAPRPADQYREPVAGPEVIDLRKTPPPPMPMPVAAAPLPPLPKPIPPLTFTKPIEKPTEPVNSIPVFRPQIPKAEPPLIEADPHVPVPNLPSVETTPPLSNVPQEQEEQKKETDEASKTDSTSAPGRPQFIIRPPGLPPADLPTDIVDLRKDKGEF